MFKAVIQGWSDFRALIVAAFARVKRDLRGKPWMFFAAIVASIAALDLFNVSAAVLWAIFLLFFLYKWENRFFGAIAIVCLILCPILLSVGQGAWAEIAAEYAYYFLVMTVTLQIVEYIREPKQAQHQA